MTNRRGFLAAILSSGMAPAAIGSGILMPTKKIFVPPLIVVQPMYGRVHEPLIITWKDVTMEELARWRTLKNNGRISKNPPPLMTGGLSN